MDAESVISSLQFVVRPNLTPPAHAALMGHSHDQRDTLTVPLDPSRYAEGERMADDQPADDEDEDQAN